MLLSVLLAALSLLLPAAPGRAPDGFVGDWGPSAYDRDVRWDLDDGIYGSFGPYGAYGGRFRGEL